ncbi:hypothetical protein GCM10023144_17170 [Pigmentiphaga soli]|uniref:CNP1-like uncharacterized domain-containing protein n=1 Tax=Pigmentiphaga soli TaxID=1007095 RepID=A0ABP8GU34_9BURK
MRSTAAVAVAVLLAACGSAKRGEGNYLLDDIEAQRNLPDSGWEALRPLLPPVPGPSDTLLPVDSLNVNDPFHYGVDPRSVQIAPGQIVRYALVSQSDRGSRNISYESVRCGTREYRLVALAAPGGAWQRAHNDEWQPVQANTVQAVLRAGVLCSGGGVATDKVPNLIARLRNWSQYSDFTAEQNKP